MHRKYRGAANISKLIMTLDDIVFIDTQVSRKVRDADSTELTHLPVRCC